MFVLTRGILDPSENWMSPTGSQELAISFLRSEIGGTPNIESGVSFIRGMMAL